MEKNTGIQQCIGNTPKKYNIKGERVKDKVEGSNICRV